MITCFERRLALWAWEAEAVDLAAERSKWTCLAETSGRIVVCLAPLVAADVADIDPVNFWVGWTSPATRFSEQISKHITFTKQLCFVISLPLHSHMASVTPLAVKLKAWKKGDGPTRQSGPQGRCVRCWERGVQKWTALEQLRAMPWCSYGHPRPPVRQNSL